MGLARKRQPKHCRRECHSILATTTDVVSKCTNTRKLLTVLAALKATSTSSLGACRSLDIGFPSGDGMQAAIRAQICALRVYSVRIRVLPFRCALLLPDDLPSPPSASKNAQAVNTTDTRRHTAGQSKGRSGQGDRRMY